MGKITFMHISNVELKLNLLGLGKEEDLVWIAVLIVGIILGYFCGKYRKRGYIFLVCAAYGIYALWQRWYVVRGMIAHIPGTLHLGGPIPWFQCAVSFFPIVWIICMYYIFYYGFKKPK